MSMMSIAAIGAGIYLGAKYLKQKATGYAKENFSFRINSARVHNLGPSGLDLRFSIDIINLSRVAVKVNGLKADVYYMKNGQPSHLATTTIKDGFTVAAEKSSRLNNIKIIVPYADLAWNLSILTDSTRNFKVALKGQVEGKNISITQNFTA